MLDVMIILLIGIAPPILSLWILHRTQSHYRQINLAIATPLALKLTALPPADLTYIDGFGYAIGQVSCKYNARSAYLRCAVNPSGACQDCCHYDSL
ncbi:DUF6464 family protein [Pseudanabaena sp. UWO310]|uniref:DUF6464 family protein n=1 Tax=Pseudanabaena sp. UWO310 TaxID=2480795 RepID=UPI00115BFFE1|nr:DUF6464 family protein [Pseudanabaena sp. UWO310]TYQ29899.1 hypothetical protein PseudUWO310_11405 [Pseudanabaena sp. UWO310]